MNHVDYLDLALKYGPILHQFVTEEEDDVYKDYNCRLDLISWEYVYSNPQTVKFHKDHLLGHGYYHVIEGEKFFYLTYFWYHPIDFKKVIGLPIGGHDHDTEGAMVIVRKSTMKPVACITIYHHSFGTYAPPKIKIKKTEKNVFLGLKSLRGHLSIHRNPTDESQNTQVELVQEAEGHGVLGRFHEDFMGMQRPRKIVYCPALEGQKPNDFPWIDDDRKYVDYALEDVFRPNGLWDQRVLVFVPDEDDGLDRIKEKDGSTIQPGKAKPPWSWGKLVDKERRLTDFVLRPNAFMRKFFGLSRDRIIYNPFAKV